MQSPMADQGPHTPGQQPHQQPPAYYPPPYPHGGHSVYEAPVNTNHTFHLLATVFTCGLWAPVWLIVWALNQSRKRKTTQTTHHW